MLKETKSMKERNNPFIMTLFVTLSILLVSIMVTCPTAYATDVFHKDDLPFGKSYESWIQSWWRWNALIPVDQNTSTFAGLRENGCLINKEGPVVMLVDPAAGSTWNQRCEISSDQGILLSLWSAECDASSPGNEKKSFEELSKCARGYNLGRIKVDALVDNTPIAKLEVNDYNTVVQTNATELYTKVFNITTPMTSHLQVERPGTYTGAVQGWFLFIKPLSPGEHTVRYINNVSPTTLSGAANTNKADFTYTLIVK